MARWYDELMNLQPGMQSPGSGARSAGDLLSSAMGGGGAGEVTSPSRPGYEFLGGVYGGQPAPSQDWTPASNLGQDPYSRSDLERGGASRTGSATTGVGAGVANTGASTTPKGGREYFYGEPTQTGTGQLMRAGSNIMSEDFRMPTLAEMKAQGMDPTTAQNILSMVGGGGNGVPAADALNIRELAPWTGRRFYEYGLPDQTNQPVQPGLKRIGV